MTILRNLFPMRNIAQLEGAQGGDGWEGRSAACCSGMHDRTAWFLPCPWRLPFRGHQTGQCCCCTDALEYPPGHYMNLRCILCGHEMHDHCGAFLLGGHSRPPGYMCDCCEAPDTDTDDEDESRLHPTEARRVRTHNVCTCRVPGEDKKQ